jgi:hypothetical protein
MTAGAAASMALVSRAWPFYQTTKVPIPLFGTTLRSIDTIGVAAPDLTPAPVTGVTHYTININQFQDAGVCPTLVCNCDVWTNEYLVLDHKRTLVAA